MFGIKSRILLPTIFHVTHGVSIVLSLALVTWAYDPALAQDQTQPMFTREGTLACPTIDTLNMATNAMNHGWHYVPTAGVSPGLGLVAKLLTGQPLSAESFGCVVYHDGFAVQISAVTFSDVQTNLGWLSKASLRNAAATAPSSPAAQSNAGIILNNSIGNDPAKEKLCASRAGGHTVPFLIDPRYVASVRAHQPDATFVATDSGSPQLIICSLRPGTGKYEPDSMSPEQAFWHLIKPPGVGIDNLKDSAKAMKTCLDTALAKSKRSGA